MAGPVRYVMPAAPRRMDDGPPAIEVVRADTPALIDAARTIFREYADSLSIDLAFQDFEAELAALPADYESPSGQLLLAFVDDALAGCGAVRALPESDYPNACEMKRLYVRPAFRGFGLGRTIAQSLMDGGQRAGYSFMLLDTLDEMEAARGLYMELGFEEVPPYYFSPIPGAHYLKAMLG